MLVIRYICLHRCFQAPVPLLYRRLASCQCRHLVCSRNYSGTTRTHLVSSWAALTARRKPRNSVEVSTFLLQRPDDYLITCRFHVNWLFCFLWLSDDRMQDCQSVTGLLSMHGAYCEDVKFDDYLKYSVFYHFSILWLLTLLLHRKFTNCSQKVTRLVLYWLTLNNLVSGHLRSCCLVYLRWWLWSLWCHHGFVDHFNKYFSVSVIKHMEEAGNNLTTNVLSHCLMKG